MSARTPRTWSSLADLVRDPSLLHDGELAPMPMSARCERA